MKLSFPPFDDFIRMKTSARSRSRYRDSFITELNLDKEEVTAKVQGSYLYEVEIKFNAEKVTYAHCSCPYDYGGACKHIIHVLKRADEIMEWERKEEEIEEPVDFEANKKGRVKVKGCKVTQLTLGQLNFIKKNISGKAENWMGYVNEVLEFKTDYLKAEVSAGEYYQPSVVEIAQRGKDFQISCSCRHAPDKFCKHMYVLLKEIREGKSSRLVFDEEARLSEYKKQAGLLDLPKLTENQLERLFFLDAVYGRIVARAKFNVWSLKAGDTKVLKDRFLPSFSLPDVKEKRKRFVVVEKAYGYSFLFMEAPMTKSGNRIKSPIRPANVPACLEQAVRKEEWQFYGLLLKERHTGGLNEEERNLLFENPLEMDFYLFEPNGFDETVTPRKIRKIEVKNLYPEVWIFVREEGPSFYALEAKMKWKNQEMPADEIELLEGCFLKGETLYFINGESNRQVLSFFEENKNKLLVTKEQFEKLKIELLDSLEDKIHIEYEFIKKAPPKMVQKKKLNKITQKIIYISETGAFIMLTPAVKYAAFNEVPLLSSRRLYYTDEKGESYFLERDKEAEEDFLAHIQKQHPRFAEVPRREFFYLKKDEFLEEGWFLDAFEDWQNQNYEIFGFDKIKGNLYNRHKMKASIHVSSGLDWFDIETQVFFGDQKVKLQDLQKAVLNRKRYVKLGDGTQGILPKEWIEKFAGYFRSGELKEDRIRTHKSNFQLIDALFEKEVLARATQTELRAYKKKLKKFKEIKEVQVSKKLKGTLRPYQKEGLNWLNFLDEFNFGGILADDMGLGKTIQIISYFLVQIEKGVKDPNLVVVPTTLLFNWQAELDKFAPSLKYKVLYGTNRDLKKVDFKKHQVFLTTYGTLLSDIEVLKEKVFNVVVLDESQAIKNPTSKRYKAVRLLKARRRIAVTGTPVENNTFDLFSQLSFVMPGLLGGQKRFKEDYALPIDKFGDEKRAAELRKKVHPFILRRTKKQVAKELPEKTEVVIHCEMDHAQRKIYEVYKEKFQRDLLGMSEKEMNVSKLHILQGLMKLRQICNSPALLSDEEYYGESSSKLEELMQQVNKLKEAHKMLIFSQFVGMLELIRERLEEEGIKYAYLTGQTKNRQEQVKQFQEDEETRIFLISLKAGGTGLNLTEAEYVFIVDPWWNPAVENQAIDRVYRIGQKNKVVAIRLIVPDTIEEKIQILQKKKLKLVEDLVHTDGRVFKSLSKEDLLDLI